MRSRATPSSTVLSIHASRTIVRYARTAAVVSFAPPAKYSPPTRTLPSGRELALAHRVPTLDAAVAYRSMPTRRDEASASSASPSNSSVHTTERETTHVYAVSQADRSSVTQAMMGAAVPATLNVAPLKAPPVAPCPVDAKPVDAPTCQGYAKTTGCAASPGRKYCVASSGAYGGGRLGGAGADGGDEGGGGGGGGLGGAGGEGGAGGGSGYWLEQR